MYYIISYFRILDKERHDEHDEPNGKNCKTDKNFFRNNWTRFTIYPVNVRVCRIDGYDDRRINLIVWNSVRNFMARVFDNATTKNIA